MDVSKNNATPKWMVKIMLPNPMNKWVICGFSSIFGNHRIGNKQITPLAFLGNPRTFRAPALKGKVAGKEFPEIFQGNPGW